MVSISYHTLKGPSPIRDRRIRLFFQVYIALTIVIPSALGMISFPVACCVAAGGAMLLVIECIQLAFFVQMGRDDSVECRWLGWVIMARLAAVCLTPLISLVIHW
jgi:hypothetical protein